MHPYLVMSNLGDAFGFMLVGGLLFVFPVWLTIYFIYETLHALWHNEGLGGGPHAEEAA